jgi:hypothetical protein
MAPAYPFGRRALFFVPAGGSVSNPVPLCCKASWWMDLWCHAQGQGREHLFLSSCFR